VRLTRTVWFLSRMLMLAAIPIGAVVWLFTRQAVGVTTALAVLFFGAVIYAVSPPRVESRPGKRDPDDPSTRPILGGRGDMMALDLQSRPLRYQRNRDDAR
jgi:hypothetical protein